MGKKAKKKTRSAHKEKRVSSGSLQTIPGHSNPADEINGDGVLVVKERKPCTHIDNGVNLAKISLKIGSLGSARCEDCREGVLERRASKGSTKHGKKKGVGVVHTNSESKSIWVCLECGYFACGGVGFPTTPQSHAVRHAKQTRHSCVIKLDNPHLCWCFPCNSLIPVEKSEENGEQKDILLDAVKLIKGRSSEGALMDVEDVWFGGGNVGNETKSESAESRVLNGRSGYVVQGLVNLGNTCFFNSVMQNLLAMDRLRDYFLKLDLSVGPLTMALKKLFGETSPETESRNVTNHKTVFGCICTNAPQFRGYQQQDSHELLCCLLDGLHTEELRARNLVNSSGDVEITSKITSNPVDTFVDSIFGGKLISTVCCVECGHSSIVYEPFLDLSLPVRTKKPPSKKAKPVARARKQKLPLKKGGKTCVKKNLDAAPELAQCAIGPSKSSEYSCQVPSSVPIAVKTVVSSSDFSIGPGTTSDDIRSVSQNDNISVIQDFENRQVFQNDAEQLTTLDDFSWLDYIEPGTEPEENDLVSHNNNILVTQNSKNKQVFRDDMLQNGSEPCSQVCLPNKEPNLELDSSHGNSYEDEFPLRVQGSEVLLLPYKENSTIEEMVRGEGEASSSIMGCQQDVLDFDGFGDLFNEPEMVSEPSTKSCLGNNAFQANEVAETGFLAGNSSESDHDEVDNTDVLVSVDSCLAYFTAPEPLSNEHAWHCENCSKILRVQKVEARKKRSNATSKTWINGGGLEIQSTPLGLNDDSPNPNELRNLNNGKTESDTVSATTAGSLVSHSGRLDDLKQNCIKHETSQTGKEKVLLLLNPISHCQDNYPDIAQGDSDLSVLNNKLQELSPSSDHHKVCSQTSFSDQDSDSCNVNDLNSSGCNLDQVQQKDYQLMPRVCESDGSECEEMDSESVKVKRDATRRIFINRAPHILTIHLKRFSQDARGRLSKLSDHVNFRDTIDLRPYMDPSAAAECDDPRLLWCEEGDDCDYRLIGVVEHSGTMRGGHYVAYVRAKKSREKTDKENEGSTWYHASDAYVHEVPLEQVLRYGRSNKMDAAKRLFDQMPKNNEISNWSTLFNGCAQNGDFKEALIIFHEMQALASDGGRRRLPLSRQTSVLDTSNLQNLSRIRDEDNNGRDTLAGLTIGAVIGYEERPEQVQLNRTLMDIIRDEDSKIIGNTNKKSWKSFKDRIRLCRATAAWSSEVSLPFQAGPSTGNSTPVPAIVQPENSSDTRETIVANFNTATETFSTSPNSNNVVVESVTSVAEVAPVRMTLMALLEETDRQAGVAGYPLMAVEEEEEEEEEEGEEYSCCVCMVRHKGAAFIPCGHTFCRLCSRELWVSRGNCPLCNGFILEILDIF
ncbi:hypothetical protein HHK36_013054 [Tetracentron sinense]|uniref:ubiquitinyl hydrolase 1 n=1 Tax=Tetracentron sinense TaxID=13715 RepID=A0A834Z985_TETSI|nr:hypothetical protein HHK36_013054 [Tetracentron sinense]